MCNNVTALTMGHRPQFPPDIAKRYVILLDPMLGTRVILEDALVAEWFVHSDWRFGDQGCRSLKGARRS
jgi:hypothetical protein